MKELDIIKNNDEVIAERYRKLKVKAKRLLENDIDDSMISYYGGYDVISLFISDYLYKLLLKNIEDIYFMEKAVSLFIKDYPTYFDEQIDICEQALYMIENAEKYYELVKLEEKELTFIDDFNLLGDCNKNIINKKGENQLELKKSLDEYKKISQKKYNLIELLRGKRKDDKIKLNNIQTKIDTLKSKLTEFENELDEIKFEFEELYKQEEKWKKKSKNYIQN